jgi:hypothetical protein
MKLKVLGSIFALGAALAVAQPAPAPCDDVADGHKYFVRYCASCHGTDGTGDGPVAKTLVTPPANLRSWVTSTVCRCRRIRLPNSSTAAIRRERTGVTRCRCGERNSTRWELANAASMGSVR